MSPPPDPISRVRVLPLSQRHSDIDIRHAAIDPDAAPPNLPDSTAEQIRQLADLLRAARKSDRAVVLNYGAHVAKNGCVRLVQELIRDGWVTHLATQGAGIIHDWEFAFSGMSSESVRNNAPVGRFGTWDEVGRAVNLAALNGAAAGRGLGESIGRFIADHGIAPPDPDALRRLIKSDPDDPLTAARMDLLNARIDPETCRLTHQFPSYSIAHAAYEQGVPLTVHPGIGYDIFSCHPLFHPAAIGRAAGTDFQRFVTALQGLSGGVYLSVGSAIASPQVFEKAFSIANNLLQQDGQPFIHDHHVTIVDIQDNGGWDWQAGEPPPEHPAYYLRFCKTFHRLAPDGVSYIQADNRAVMHALVHAMRGSGNG